MRSNLKRTALLFLLIAAPLGAQQQYTMANGAATGRITISGGSTVRSWSCDVTRFDATVRSPGAIEALPSGRERASFDIPVAGIDCRNRTMNGHLREALRGDDHPNIAFELTSYTLTDESTLQARGTLTVGGRSTPIELVATYTPGTGTLRVQGEKVLRMTALGVEPPTLMLGTLKVHDPVTIGFDLVIRQSAVTLAARNAAGGR